MLSCCCRKRPGKDGSWQPMSRAHVFLQGGIGVLCRLMLLVMGFWWIDERFPEDGASSVADAPASDSAAAGDAKAVGGGSPAKLRTGCCRNVDGGCLAGGLCLRCDATPFVSRPGAPKIIVANHSNFVGEWGWLGAAERCAHCCA